MSEKRSTPKEHTSRSIVKESSKQIWQHNHKPNKIRMHEDPKDIDTSSEGLKSNSEDHWTRTEEKKKNLSPSKRRKSTNKTSTISAFNVTQYPLSWLY